MVIFFVISGFLVTSIALNATEAAAQGAGTVMPVSWVMLSLVRSVGTGGGCSRPHR